MKYQILLVALFPFFSVLHVVAQLRTGEWKTHYSYTCVTTVEDGGDLVYALGDNSLFSVNKSDKSIATYSKVTGLNGSDIRCIKYDAISDLLVLAYSDGNIDLLYSNGSVVNLPELKNSSVAADKSPNALTVDEKGFIYLANKIGILLINPTKKEIADTYIIGQNSSYLPVVSVTTTKDSIYALTSDALYSASRKEPLLADYQKWSKNGSLPGGENKKVLFVGGKFYLQKQAGEVFFSDNARIWNLLSEIHYDDISSSDNEYLLCCHQLGLDCFKDCQHVSSIVDMKVRAANYNALADSYWLAADTMGLIMATEGEMQQRFRPEGPYTNGTFSLEYANNRLYALTGAPINFSSNHNAEGALMILENEKWKNITKKDINPIAYRGNNYFISLCHIALDEKDKQHYFISSFRDGLYEFRGDTLFRYFNGNADGSTIEPMNPSSPYDYVTVEGIALDKKGALWMTNALVTNGVKVKTEDDNWYSYSYEGFSSPWRTDRITVTSNNFKWMNWPRSDGGILVINDKGKPENRSAHSFRMIRYLPDQDGNSTLVTPSYCYTEDLNGNVWVGTDDGVMEFRNVSNIFNAGYSIRRPKIARNDGTNYADFLLDDQRVNAIVVDGANRKWIGTNASGLLLMSEDGTEEIAHFTEGNSPLISNQINSLALDQETGELFIATDKGLMSYKTDATESGNDFEKIKVFPNPVRENFTGVITIDGLVDGSLVKITDAAGNLVYRTKSNGGRAVWDGRNLSGRRVVAGVYFILGSVERGGETKSGVGKFLLIR